MSTLLYIASDHRGFLFKQKIIVAHGENSREIIDLGAHDETRCDASRFAVKMAEAMKQQTDSLGILICGSGQAMAITANRYQHLRAALCLNSTMARLAREHNDANVLVLGADLIGEAVMQDCLTAFMQTKFLGGRYADRRDYLTNLGGL